MFCGTDTGRKYQMRSLGLDESDPVDRMAFVMLDLIYDESTGLWDMIKKMYPPEIHWRADDQCGV